MSLDFTMLSPIFLNRCVRYHVIKYFLVRKQSCMPRTRNCNLEYWKWNFSGPINVWESTSCHGMVSLLRRFCLTILNFSSVWKKTVNMERVNKDSNCMFNYEIIRLWITLSDSKNLIQIIKQSQQNNIKQYKITEVCKTREGKRKSTIHISKLPS